jgi:CRP-like cAMP-binding protein
MLPARSLAMLESMTIRPVERILYLRKLGMLANLPSPELTALAQNTRERTFAKGEVLLHEGEPVGAVHLVVDGAVTATRHGRVLGRLGAGSALGGLAILARDSQGLHAVADTQTLVLTLERDALLEVCEDHFAVVQEMLHYICKSFIEVQSRAWPAIGGATRPLSDPYVPEGEIDFVERILLLRNMGPFRRASINALAELSRNLTEVRFGAGVPLWRQDDASRYLLLTVTGTIVCSRRDHPGPVRVGRGIALGAAEAMAEVPRWYDAVTETPVVALHASNEPLIDVFEDNFEMAMDYLGFLSQLLLLEIDREAAQGGAADPSSLGKV